MWIIRSIDVKMKQMNESESLVSLWPILVYAGGVVLLVAIMLVASYFLGERHKETATDTG